MGNVVNGTWEAHGERVWYQSQVVNLAKDAFSPKEVTEISGHFVSMWHSHGVDTGTLNIKSLVHYEDGRYETLHYHFIGRMVAAGTKDVDVRLYILCIKIEDTEEFETLADISAKILNVTRLSDYVYINPELN
jgi:hypothetical protein